jgi:hypothetical protein
MILTHLLALSCINPGAIQALPEKPVENARIEIAKGKWTAFPAPANRLSVIVFLEPTCPIANRMAPELSRISKKYSEKGVAFFFSYVGPDVTLGAASDHARERAFTGVSFGERKSGLVQAVGATITPEAAVVDRAGRVLYRGRINDLYVDHASTRAKITRHDLRLALDEALAGRPISVPVTMAVGCFIPR